MRTRIAVVIVSTLVVGCGVGRLVRPDESVAGGGDALFALEVHTNRPATLMFCRDGDYGSCLTTDRLAADQDVLEVYAIPPGRYCLMTIQLAPQVANRLRHEITPDRARCFDTRRDTIAYPGDLVISARSIEGNWWRVGQSWELGEGVGRRVARRVYAAYPNLRGRRIERAPLTPYQQP